MLNFIWIAMMLTAVSFGIIDGRIAEVVQAVTTSAKFAFEIALGLAGIMALWLGIMKIAEDAGLINIIARLLKPLMTRLFPEVPAEHPAMGAMVLNMAANMLGMGNAATPLGLKAIQYLESLNENPGVATNAMCTFVAINTASLQLIPATAIAYLAANGATKPTAVIASALVASSCATLVAIIAVKLFARLFRFKANLVGKPV